MESMSDRVESRPPLPPPRFSLRTLLLVITFCGLFFGSFWWFSPSLVIAGSVVAILVAAHVVGNSLGTQLRDRAAARRRPLDTKLQAAEVSENRAPTTHLGQPSSLGWGMLGLTLGGAVVGMIGGCWWIEA